MGGAEENVPDTWRFSIDVARSWEQAANDIIVPQTRKVLLRAAMEAGMDPELVRIVLRSLLR